MRIVTWNINGIRTIPQYHPWNTLKSHDDILNKLEADIICFQETKTSRAALTRDVASPPSYHSFFSFPVKKTGYSGVATYTRIAMVTPLKAEEGLSGLVQPKPPLTVEERISNYRNYPPQILDEDDVLDCKNLDSEGRAVVVDFGLFVLINVYCPNDGAGTEERDRFKMDYHRMLEARVKGLVENEQREVIVLGDINACAAVIDHCEGSIIVARGKAEGLEGEDAFYAKEYRRWLRGWLQNEDGTGGPLVDIVRRFWPNRKGMYTCWNTKIQARETNYGTRIDYILITPGLIPWIKAANTQPEIKGSDHCPVFVDFHHEITDKNGVTVKLEDVLGVKPMPNENKEPPRLASKFWEEYSSKQIRLDTFFRKTTTSQKLPTVSPSQPLTAGGGSLSQINLVSSQFPVLPDSTPPFVTDTPPATINQSLTYKQPLDPTLKRKSPDDNSNNPSKVKKQKGSDRKGEKDKSEKKSSQGQIKLSSFLNKPTTPNDGSSKGKTPPSGSNVIDVDIDEDEDWKLAVSLSQELCSSGGGNGEKVKQSWNNLLAPVQPPKCKVHGEPTKEYTVNKPGPNKGKKFYICSRPVGPGYDKGRAERLREEVNPLYRCDFFKWSTDWRREAKKLELSEISTQGANDTSNV